MICQNCGEREAKISITQIVNNKKTQVHFCHQCAQQGGHTDGVFALHKLLSGMVDWEPQAPVVTCSVCGLKEKEFRKSGRLGCEGCYETWQPLVESILGRIQGSLNHTGKVPRSAGENAVKVRQNRDLKAALAEAVRSENFEEAARIRDQIRELEQEGEGGS